MTKGDWLRAVAVGLVYATAMQVTGDRWVSASIAMITGGALLATA